MEISEIKKIVELVKKVNCKNWALATEVAKEMGVKKTALMQFIVDNPKLFKVVPYIGGITNNAKAKNLGLVIKTVYGSAEENPETDEWLEAQKKAWEKKLHISLKDYYGTLEFYYIAEDKEREGQYRNTPEKIKELEDAGILKKTSVSYGGWGDCTTIETYRITNELLDKLAGAGWTTDFEKIRIPLLESKYTLA